MITRALDASHDWTFGKGRQDYLREGEAIAQSIKTRLMSFVGDCYFDQDAGIDWWRFMGGKERQALLAQIRSIILNTEGVLRIPELNAVFNPATRGIQISYTIDTIYTFGQPGGVQIQTPV
jgi:hypothetical protein